MFLSVIITTYWVLGVKYEKDKQTPFSFILPFTAFRDVSNEMYWQEVLDKIYETSGADKDCEIYVATQEEYLLSSDYFKKVSRISDILTKNKLPLVYLGETRGSVEGVVTPFIINPGDFYRWFYLAENINSVENYFYNRRAYGVREPDGSWEQGFEESLFREKLTYLIENTRTDFFERTKDLILTGEGVIFAGGSKRVVLSFLDSAKPGFWRIYIDKDILLLNLEIVKIFNEAEYKNRADSVKVEDLAGCLVVPNAEKLELKDASNTLMVNLEEDSISVIPFDKNNKYQVKVFKGKDSAFFEVSGGELGLIVDNRIRPLLRDKSSKQRVSLIEKWTKEISQKVDLGNTKQDDGNTPIEKKILNSGVEVSEDNVSSSHPGGKSDQVKLGTRLPIGSKDDETSNPQQPTSNEEKASTNESSSEVLSKPSHSEPESVGGEESKKDLNQDEASVNLKSSENKASKMVLTKNLIPEHSLSSDNKDKKITDKQPIDGKDSVPGHPELPESRQAGVSGSRDGDGKEDTKSNASMESQVKTDSPQSAVHSDGEKTSYNQHTPSNKDKNNKEEVHSDPKTTDMANTLKIDSPDKKPTGPSDSVSGQSGGERSKPIESKANETTNNQHQTSNEERISPDVIKSTASEAQSQLVGEKEEPKKSASDTDLEELVQSELSGEGTVNTDKKPTDNVDKKTTESTGNNSAVIRSEVKQSEESLESQVKTKSSDSTVSGEESSNSSSVIGDSDPESANESISRKFPGTSDKEKTNNTNSKLRSGEKVL